MRGAVKAAMFFTLAILAGCSKPNSSLYPPEPDHPDNKSVYIINHGWHSGIALSSTDTIALKDNFPNFPYIEFGWGDEKYYQAKEPTLWMTLKAALWPSSSVLHLRALPDEPPALFMQNDVVRIELSRQGFEALYGFIDAAFERDEKGRRIPLQIAAPGTGSFYRAKGTFHLFNNCNSWVAEALHASGFPISPSCVFTSEGLFNKIKYQ